MASCFQQYGTAYPGPGNACVPYYMQLNALIQYPGLAAGPAGIGTVPSNIEANTVYEAAGTPLVGNYTCGYNPSQNAAGCQAAEAALVAATGQCGGVTNQPNGNCAALEQNWLAQCYQCPGGKPPPIKTPPGMPIDMKSQQFAAWETTYFNTAQIPAGEQYTYSTKCGNAVSSLFQAWNDNNQNVDAAQVTTAQQGVVNACWQTAPPAPVPPPAWYDTDLGRAAIVGGSALVFGTLVYVAILRAR